MRWGLGFVILFFVFISLLIYINRTIEPISVIEETVQRIFSAPKAFLYSKGANFGVNTNTEIEQLKKENRILVEKMADYENLKKDNQAFRSQFETGGIKTDEVIPARIIGAIGGARSPHTLVIDRGKRDGIKAGMSVAYGKHLVGVVASVEGAYSRIMLPVNLKFRFVGKTLEKDAIGIITGEDNFAVFDQVVITDTLANGDIVVTKGDIKNNDISIQDGLIVGKISSVNKSDTKPFQSAKIVPLIDYSRITMVFVLKERK